MAQATIGGRPCEVPAELLEVETQLTTLLRSASTARLPMPGLDGRTLERSAYLLLVRLMDQGPQRGSDLAAGLGLDFSTVSRQVAGLCELGLVERAADVSDRRANLLTLTAKGRQVSTGCRQLRRAKLLELMSGWSVRDRTELARLLGRLNRDLDRLHGHPAHEAPLRTSVGMPA